MKAISLDKDFVTKIVENDLLVDTTTEKGGTGLYTRPHDLLEAALATCLNIVLQKEAKKNQLDDLGFETSVKINRDNPEETCFEYSYKIITNRSTDNLKELFDKALLKSSVRNTLSKAISFIQK